MLLQQRVSRAWPGVLVVVLALALFWQPLKWMVGIWLTDAYYSHGFLVPLIAIALVWRSRADLRHLPGGSSLVGLALVIAGLLMAVLGGINQALFVASLGLPVLAAGVALYLKGQAALRYLLFPALYLVLMIPLPFVATCAWQLQVWTSWLATGFANLVGVPATQLGASVSIPNAAYVVGISCSGLSSIVALLALGTLIIYMSKGSVLARLVLVVALTPIAILSNGFRVGSMLFIAFHFGGDAGLIYHDTVAGFISWAVALVLLFIGLRITRCRFSLGA